jgi:hypothetical protein
MNERILWERFKKTGKIEDYLSYTACKRELQEYRKITLGQVK